MNLAVFDVDGTLCRTNSVDADCVTRAFAETLRIPVPSSDWSVYRESTDSGILAELCQIHLKRDPTIEEKAGCPRRFLELLDEVYTADPGRFQAVPGAAEMINSIRKDPAWRPAIATGGFRMTALFKLRAAGINVRGIPLATADDSESRNAIVETALSRARADYDVPEFAKIVYVGDGIWDLRTAREMGLGFLGVTGDFHAASPGYEGERTIRDFADYGSFLKALSAAR